MPGCCETGRNVQKYRGGGGGGTASTLQEALENSNVATIDINLISGAKFRGDGSALSNVPINGGNLNLQQVTNQDNQTTNEIIITNTGTSLTTSGAINASGNITAPSFIGSGSSLTGLNVTNASSGILQVARGGTGVTTGLTSLDGSNITSGTVALVRGGTGATSASTAASNLGLGTSDSPQFTGVNIGHASDTTITRSSAGVIAVEGKIVRTDDVALGTETSGNYVATITGGDGIASTGATTGETIDHSLSVDTKTNGGLAIESGKLALKLDDSSITGVLNASDGGTGVTTGLSQLNAGNITSGTVPTIYGGTGVTTGLSVLNATNLTSGTVNTARGGTGVTTGLSVLNATNLTSGTVATARGGTGVTTGLTVLDPSNLSGPVAISKGGTGVTTGLSVLDPSNLSGPVSISKGGTGAITASAAVTALGIGPGSTPQFTAIELGNASDTTIARSGAGKVTIEGNEIRTGTVESDKGGTGQTSYNVGEILVANDPNSTGTPTLHKLPPGSSGYFLKSTGNGSFPTWGDVSSVGSATPGQLFTGVGLTGANAISDGNTPPTFTGGHTGAGDTTISVDSATGNVASKLVMRDTSGDIRVQEVIVGTTGGTTGSLTSTAWSGSAATLTNARDIGGQSFDGSASINLPGVDIPGTVNTSGNAATATKLATARDIGGQSFDGTANINLPGVNQSGNQDTSGNAATATRLAAAVNIGGASFDGSAAIQLPGVDIAGTVNTSGNAATATRLASAVNIGGASFDGSAAIQLPGVDIAGTVDTSGKAGSITNTSDTTTSTDQNIAFLIGNNVKTNTNLTINPSTAELKATKFTAGTGGFVDSTFTNKGVIYYDSTSGKLVSTALGTVGQVIKADTNGVPVWGTDSGGVGGSGYWTQPSGTTIIHYNTGNVGINTSTPQYKLDVNGDIRTTSEGGFRGNGGNITGINITSETSQTIINFGQQSSLKVSANGDPD